MKSSDSAAAPTSPKQGLVYGLKAKRQVGSRREEILDHAQRLFAAHGVHSVSTRQIADAVGISQPSLYAHFPSKADIMEEVSARAFERVRLAGSTAEHAAGDPVEAMIRAYVEFGLAEPDAYRIAFMIEGLYDAAGDVKLEAGKKGAANQAFDALRSVVADRLGPANSDVDVAAQSLWASMHGLVALLLARGGFPWVERSRLIDWHVEQLSTSLRKSGRVGPRRS